MFEKLNEIKLKGQIKDFRISITSLDDMFIKMAQTASKTNNFEAFSLEV